MDEAICYLCGGTIETSVTSLVQFYNQCHGPDGRFCSGPGAGSSVVGRTALPDRDGDTVVTTGTVKRGKKGGSLVDPHDGTRTVEGIRGYDDRGKPVPGTDAWLEAHGISRKVFESRPYIKYEADRDDPALIEAYEEYPQAEKFFRQRAEQDGQSGGVLMYKTEVPGSPWGPIPPQARPNKELVTNAAKKAYAETVLANDIERLELIKKTSPTALRAERREQVKKAELNLERIKTATPDKIRDESEKNLSKASDNLKKAKESGNLASIVEAKKIKVSEQRQYDKDQKAARNWDPEKELYFAEIAVTHSKNRLEKSISDPKAALAQEIKSQERTLKRSEKRLQDTAAKYVFPPGTSSARIDMNPDPQNVKNLVSGKGRIYFAMEGSIKNDAILTALKKEDPTASVVNVPSVTLWQQKAGLPGEASGEVMWFAREYGKGREIVLIPDADGVKNPNVMMQAKALSTALRTNGAGNVILAAPPLKKGTTKVVDKFQLSSGANEERKGIDDHLGGGRGELGQLQYTNTKKVPSYNLNEYTKAGGATDVKMSRGAVKNAEAALAAISGIAGPEGITKMPKKMLAQTSNLPITSAKDARDTLERLGVITVEHVFDEKALGRGKRIRNPKVSDERVSQLVRTGVIKEPQLDKLFTEVSIDESPVVTIVNKKYTIKREHVEVGTLSDLPSWERPKNYKGWTSPINNEPDKTGIAARQVDQAAKRIAKKAAAAPEPIKVAPPGRRIVRSPEGSKRYGVNIGQLIPLSESSITSMVPLDMEGMTYGKLVEFYNTCHGPDGRFCETPGGSVSGRLSRESGLDAGGWPASKGRTIATVAKSRFGSVEVDGVKAKTVYEVTDNNGNKIRLYDKTGKAGNYAKDLLQNHARMNEMYPLRPPRSIVVTKPGNNVDKNDLSMVFSKHPDTYVNSDLLGYDTKNLRDGYMMPGAKTGNTKNMDYVLTHEYGHHVDFSKNVQGGTHKAHPLTKDPAFNKAMSIYGKTNPIESYAESFAEWHYSRGRTTNPAAIAMARYEGWYGVDLTASISPPVLSMVNYGLVSFNNLLSFEDKWNWETEEKVSMTFYFQSEEEEFPEGDIDYEVPDLDGGIAVIDNFEDGPRALGATEKEPSKAEIAKATRIMREVLSDQGKDYDDYIKEKA